MNELRSAGTQVSVVMPWFFPSALLETMRGPEEAHVLAETMMQQSEYSAEKVAHDLLTESAHGHTYIVLPGAARTMWRMKRWMPVRFLETVRRFARRYQSGESTASKKRV